MAGKFGVIGFGTMGSEIGLLAACAGDNVVVLDRFLDDNDRALKRLAQTLRRQSRNGNFFAGEAIATDDGRDEIISRISFTDTESGLEGCGFIVEAAPEDVKLKHEILSAVAGQVGETAIIASNTSSISITEIASAVSHPDRVVGMHFFNPPVQMDLVEVIPGLSTSEAVLEQAEQMALRLGKKAIRVRETPGFVVNRILLAMMVEAISLAESGISSMEDIDEAMRLGAGWPMGPFRLADLVGLDVIDHACQGIYSELGDPKFKPPVLLRRYVRAGRLGRKTRHGFYKY